jgi:hypothetical protein
MPDVGDVGVMGFPGPRRLERFVQSVYDAVWGAGEDVVGSRRHAAHAPLLFPSASYPHKQRLDMYEHQGPLRRLHQAAELARHRKSGKLSTARVSFG